MKKFFYLMLLLAVPAFMTSCEKDDDEEIVTPQEEPEQPVNPEEEGGEEGDPEEGEEEISDYRFIKMFCDFDATPAIVNEHMKNSEDWDSIADVVGNSPLDGTPMMHSLTYEIKGLCSVRLLSRGLRQNRRTF